MDAKYEGMGSAVRCRSASRAPVRGAALARATGGFSLIEILVGLAIVVVLATVVTPNMIGMLDRARVDRGVASLENLSSAIADFEGDVKRAPSSLTQLVTPITAEQQSSCGKNYPNGLLKDWAGPYLSRVIPEGGIPIAVGTVTDALDQIDEGPRATLRLTIVLVSQEDAIEIDRRIDGDGDPLGGAIRYSAPDAAGLVELYYHVPVKGC